MEIYPSQLPSSLFQIIRRHGGSWALFAGAITAGGSNALAAERSDWTEPYPPFQIAGSLYYVGSKDLATYLIATPEGSILINSCLEANVPMIQSSVEELGFNFADVKILLISHAHWDHCAGSALIKKLTGAAYYVMEGDVPVVESGGRADFHYGNESSTYFPEARVDRVLHDGDEVSLGGVSLVAHLTPGHTRGCTTWTMNIADGDRSYNAVIVGSPNVNTGFILVNNARYPEIADDFEQTFRVLKALPCDLFLGAHGSYFGMVAKRERVSADGANALVDPDGYRKWIAAKERAFRDELAKQRTAAAAASSDR